MPLKTSFMGLEKRMVEGNDTYYREKQNQECADLSDSLAEPGADEQSMVATRIDETPSVQIFKCLLKEERTDNGQPDKGNDTVEEPFPKSDLIGTGQFHGCDNQKQRDNESRETETAVYPEVGTVSA